MKPTPRLGATRNVHFRKWPHPLFSPSPLSVGLFSIISDVAEHTSAALAAASADIAGSVSSMAPLCPDICQPRTQGVACRFGAPSRRESRGFGIGERILS